MIILFISKLVLIDLTWRSSKATLIQIINLIDFMPGCDTVALEVSRHELHPLLDLPGLR
jgi:hypothetical protein